MDFPETQPKNTGKDIKLRWEMLLSIIDCMRVLRGLHVIGEAGFLDGELDHLQLRRQPWLLLDVSFFIESYISASLFWYCDVTRLHVLRIMCDAKPIFDQLFCGPVRNILKLEQVQVWCDMNSPTIYATVYPKLQTISISHLDDASSMYSESRGRSYLMPHSPESNYDVCCFCFLIRCSLLIEQVFLDTISRPEIPNLARLALTISLDLALSFAEMCHCPLTLTHEMALYEHVAEHVMNSRPGLHELMIIDGAIHGTNWVFVRDDNNSGSSFKMPAKKGPNSRFAMFL